MYEFLALAFQSLAVVTNIYLSLSSLKYKSLSDADADVDGWLPPTLHARRCEPAVVVVVVAAAAADAVEHSNSSISSLVKASSSLALWYDSSEYVSESSKSKYPLCANGRK